MNIIREKSSFRDPAGYVFEDRKGNIYRRINRNGITEFIEIKKFKVLDESYKNKFIPKSTVIKKTNSFLLIKHEKIPYISYPYEWDFNKLKKAAIHHLDFHIFLLQKGFSLKDSSSFNVQFIGNNPIFIDVLSITKYKDGDLWVGYKQFCEHFYFPLILSSALKIPVSNILKSSINGIELDLTYKLLKFTDVIKPSNLIHISIPFWIKKYFFKQIDENKNIKNKKIKKQNLEAFLKSMKMKIESLNYGYENFKSTWSGYENENFYSNLEYKLKTKVVSDFISRLKPKLLFDLGCNTGFFSELSIKNGADYVVGFDFDHSSIAKANQRSKNKKFNDKFLGLVMDLTNPSANIGWHQKERNGFIERATPNAVIALALSHHIIISNNIPIKLFVSWLVSISQVGIVEFIPKNDIAIQKMIKHREDIFNEYTYENFKKELSSKVEIKNEIVISKSGRVLFEYSKL